MALLAEEEELEVALVVEGGWERLGGISGGAVGYDE